MKFTCHLKTPRAVIIKSKYTRYRHSFVLPSDDCALSIYLEINKYNFLGHYMHHCRYFECI